MTVGTARKRVRHSPVALHCLSSWCRQFHLQHCISIDSAKNTRYQALMLCFVCCSTALTYVGPQMPKSKQTRWLKKLLPLHSRSCPMSALKLVIPAGALTQLWHGLECRFGNLGPDVHGYWLSLPQTCADAV